MFSYHNIFTRCITVYYFSCKYLYAYKSMYICLAIRKKQRDKPAICQRAVNKAAGESHKNYSVYFSLFTPIDLIQACRLVIIQIKTCIPKIKLSLVYIKQVYNFLFMQSRMPQYYSLFVWNFTFGDTGMYLIQRLIFQRIYE